MAWRENGTAWAGQDGVRGMLGGRDNVGGMLGGRDGMSGVLGGRNGMGGVLGGWDDVGPMRILYKGQELLLTTSYNLPRW
jgi:hypothetical protein